MPEQATPSLGEQKKIKPKVEDLIPEYLDGDMKKAALDFVAYLRSNRMAPGWAGFTNAWKANCKGRCICYIRLGMGGASSIKNVRLVVAPFLENIKKYEQTIIDEGLQRFVWENVLYCVHKPIDSPPPEELRNYSLTLPCNIWNCAPGKDITVCGKELTHICRNSNRQHFWFHDPDEETLECIKRLVELEKKARTEI